MTLEELQALTARVTPRDRVVLTEHPLTTVDRATQNVEVRPFKKPLGLWYACGDEWLTFLYYNAQSFLPDYHHAYSITVKPRVLLNIRTVAQLDAFQDKFGSEDRIRWFEVAHRYAGIEICPYLDSRRYRDWYYGWDVASGCIWDPRGVGSIDELAQFT